MLIAETNVATSRLIPLSEGKARDWVAALPIADLGETTKRLFYGLVDFNRRAVPAPTRVAIGELIMPTLDLCLDNLQRHLAARAFPLTPKSQKIFELTQSLMLEFAGLYQVAALDVLTKKEGNKRTLQVALYRGLDYMARVLLLSYSVYVRTRETLWHDMHHLYLIAVENGVDQVKIKEGYKGAATIEARYLQANVLALSKPYSLRQGEAIRLMQYYAQHTELMGLGKEVQSGLTKSVHVAILNSDEPAVLMPLSDLPHSPTVRVLHLSALITKIDAHIRQLEEKQVHGMIMQEGLSRNLAKRVIYYLTTVRNRSFNRFAKNEKVGMVMQLKDVLEVVTEALNKEHGKTTTEEDALFNVFAYDENESEGGSRKIALKTASDEQTARIQTWRVMNSSVGGYGLCWDGKEESGARVGEIVALKDMNNEHAVWMIGVIKWMEFMPNKGLCCGVEVLSTKTMIFSVLEVKGRKIQQKLPMDGLMLPSVEGVRPDPTLILPAYVLNIGDEIRLKFAERTEQVKLILLDECLGAFAYFRFDTLIEKEVESQEDDFTSLWASL